MNSLTVFLMPCYSIFIKKLHFFLLNIAQLLRSLLCKPVSPFLAPIGDPANWAHCDLGSAVGAYEVHLLAHEDGCL